MYLDFLQLQFAYITTTIQCCFFKCSPLVADELFSINTERFKDKIFSLLFLNPAVYI